MKYIVFALSLMQASGQSLFTTVTPQGNGRATIRIENHGSKAATAFVVTWFNNSPSSDDGRPRRSASRHISDSAIHNRQPVLLPGECTEFPVGTPGRIGNPMVTLQAAIFEDGSTFGDSKWVALLLKRRQAFNDTITAALNEVRDAKAKRISAEELAKQLTLSQTQQLAKINEAIQGDLDAAKELDPDLLKNVYNEQTPELKDANLAFFADEERRSCVRQIYSFLLKNLSEPNIDLLITNLSDDLRNLQAAKP